MIYLFNNKEELIHIIKEQDLIEFTHKIEINTFDAAEFELPIEAIDKEIIEQMRFFGFFVRGSQFGMFKSYEVTMDDNYIIKGLDRAESDLRTVRIIKDMRLQSVTADQALNVALEGTGYQVGVKEGLTKVNKTNFYYISPREALVKIIEAFNCEFRVRYEFVENKIINRYIDLYHRQGSYSGVQFEYGNNALEVTMEEDSDNVVTALIGRGKGEESTDSEGNATGGYGRRIEFTDIVWTKASGKPIDKPAGQNYIVLNDDIENKGLYQNGELKHRWGVFVDEEIEDKEVLLQATYQELLRLNNPIRKYKASILDLRDDIWLGDRVAIVKDSAKLSFEARIFSITIDKLNFDQSEVELGDYETLKSRSQSSSLNAIKEAVRELSEEQEAYNRKVQELIDNKNAEIAEKMRVMRLDMDNGIEDAKNKAEKVKQEIAGTIDQKISGFKQSTDKAIAEANIRSSRALAMAGASADLGREAKEIANDNVRELNAFRTNVQVEREKLSDELKRYSREETTNQITAIRERFSNGYVAKSTYVENVESTKQRFEALTKDNEAKLAEFRQGIDGQLTTLSSQIAGKVNEIDFQKVKESSLLYERILGKSEADAPDKLSRLVMSSEIFQTEVGKYSTQGGPNLLRNSRADDGLKYWNGDPAKFKFLEHHFYLNGQKRMFLLENGAVVNSPRFIFKKNTDYTLNFLAFDANTARVQITLRKRKKNSANQDYDEIQTLFDNTGSPAFSSHEAVKKSLKFNIGDFDNGYLLFQYTGNPTGWSGMFMTELDFYEGSNDRKWQPAPEDSEEPIEAVRTQVTQLAGSWSVRNLNSNGDVLNSINLLANGTNRIDGRLTHITGQTLIDNAVIKSAMVDKLKTGNFESGSVTTQILASNAVTADKLLVDSAMINKLVSNQAFIRELTSQKAFITQLASIDISAEHIKGGRLSANNGSTVFDLDNGTLNMYSNTGTIRRIDDTSSSQFIKLTKSGFVAEQFRDSNAALMVFGTNHNKDPKEVERHDNKTFAGIRIWSGKGSGAEESLTEFIGDRVLIYNNKNNRSPWNFHNNMQGKETYLLPMNENGVKHYIGRGDFFLEALYSRKVFLANGKDAGAYLWDLLTCFGMMVRHGMISNSTIKNHIQGILNGYGFRV